MNGINVRDAGPGDLETVFSIESESSGGWPQVLFESEFKNGFSRTVLAEVNGGYAGYAVVWIIEGDLQLNKICVRPGFRRMGIASAILNFLLTNLNPAKVMLEVAEKNIPARGLYESAGFTRSGFRKNYYPDDNAILMDLVKK